MSQLYILYEHATGYALFRVNEFEEVGMLLPQVVASSKDLSRFRNIVSLVGFSAFKTAVVALENINNISEGMVSEHLQDFLNSCVPKSKTVTLGIADTKLGANITEALGIKCDYTNVILEIIRGIRCHFPNLVKGLTSQSVTVAQLGLAHSYSRAKVKFNVNRVDNMIIQSINLMDQLDKDLNLFSMRIREWYSYHFPELVKIVPDNYMYARVAQLIKNRKEFDLSGQLEALQEIVMDETKAKAIVDAANSSMGMDINQIDLMNVEVFARRVVALVKYRERLTGYLRNRMDGVAPNLANLIGDQVGARLISRAGSLTNLAKLPSSSVQILGAEKSLFRALKTRGNTPKFGLLFNTTYIGRAGTRDKGRISRCLANKCSLASRLDCFADRPVDVFGKKLRQQMDDRLKFYETGEIPKKNIDVMREAMMESFSLIESEEKAASPEKKKKKDKKKKRKSLENGTEENGHAENHTEEMDAPRPKKKKKSKRSVENE